MFVMAWVEIDWDHEEADSAIVEDEASVDTDPICVIHPKSPSGPVIVEIPALVRSLECALWYYEAFRDKSPKGDTELQDISVCRALLVSVKKGLQEIERSQNGHQDCSRSPEAI